MRFGGPECVKNDIFDTPNTRKTIPNQSPNFFFDHISDPKPHTFIYFAENSRGSKTRPPMNLRLRPLQIQGPLQRGAQDLTIQKVFPNIVKRIHEMRVEFCHFPFGNISNTFFAAWYFLNICSRIAQMLRRHSPITNQKTKQQHHKTIINITKMSSKFQ